VRAAPLPRTPPSVYRSVVRSEHRQWAVLPVLTVAFAVLLVTGCAARPSLLAGPLAEAHEALQAGRTEEAVDRYRSMLARHRDDEFAPIALNNLGVALEELKRFSEAETAYRRLVDRFPGSALVPAAMFRVAVNAERCFRWEVAIDQYQALVERFPDAADAPLAAFNRARLLEALLRRAEAARAYRDYAARWPTAEDAEACRRRAEWLEGKRESSTDEEPAVPVPVPSEDEVPPGDFRTPTAPAARATR
jgi:TolA-binding protein